MLDSNLHAASWHSCSNPLLNSCVRAGPLHLCHCGTTYPPCLAKCLTQQEAEHVRPCPCLLQACNKCCKPGLASALPIRSNAGSTGKMWQAILKVNGRGAQRCSARGMQQDVVVTQLSSCQKSHTVVRFSVTAQPPCPHSRGSCPTCSRQGSCCSAATIWSRPRLSARHITAQAMRGSTRYNPAAAPPRRPPADPDHAGRRLGSKQAGLDPDEHHHRGAPTAQAVGGGAVDLGLHHAGCDHPPRGAQPGHNHREVLALQAQAASTNLAWREKQSKGCEDPKCMRAEVGQCSTPPPCFADRRPRHPVCAPCRRSCRCST